MTAARSELERLLGREALRAYLDTVGGAIELLPPDASDAGIGASLSRTGSSQAAGTSVRPRHAETDWGT